MADKLRDEIKQSKPFSGLEQEAILNIQRTSGHVTHISGLILKQHGLTNPQYNVLRILRGAGPGGLRCSEIGERMISRDPDITRLLEKLRMQGLIERRREERDRRIIYAEITGRGSELLEALDPFIKAATESMLAHMHKEKLTQLIDLLEEVREAVAE